MPATVTIPLDELPDGELDLSLYAFGNARTVPLRKVGRTVTELRNEDRAGAIMMPANDEWKLPAAIAFKRPDCAEEVPR